MQVWLWRPTQPCSGAVVGKIIRTIGWQPWRSTQGWLTLDKGDRVNWKPIGRFAFLLGIEQIWWIKPGPKETSASAVVEWPSRFFLSSRNPAMQPQALSLTHRSLAGGQSKKLPFHASSMCLLRSRCTPGRVWGRWGSEVVPSASSRNLWETRNSEAHPWPAGPKTLGVGPGPVLRSPPGVSEATLKTKSDCSRYGTQTSGWRSWAWFWWLCSYVVEIIKCVWQTLA